MGFTNKYDTNAVSTRQPINTVSSKETSVYIRSFSFYFSVCPSVCLYVHALYDATVGDTTYQSILRLQFEFA